jgi:hypothetical protein
MYGESKDLTSLRTERSLVDDSYIVLGPYDLAELEK